MNNIYTFYINKNDSSHITNLNIRKEDFLSVNIVSLNDDRFKISIIYNRYNSIINLFPINGKIYSSQNIPTIGYALLNDNYIPSLSIDNTAVQYSNSNYANIIKFSLTGFSSSGVHTISALGDNYNYYICNYGIGTLGSIDSKKKEINDKHLLKVSIIKINKKDFDYRNVLLNNRINIDNIVHTEIINEKLIVFYFDNYLELVSSVPENGSIFAPGAEPDYLYINFNKPLSYIAAYMNTGSDHSLVSGTFINNNYTYKINLTSCTGINSYKVFVTEATSYTNEVLDNKSLIEYSIDLVPKVYKVNNSEGDIFVSGSSGSGGDISAHTGDSTIHFTVSSIDHGSIAGLSDNDHPQYTLNTVFTGHTGNSTIHFTQAQINIGNSQVYDFSEGVYNNLVAGNNIGLLFSDPVTTISYTGSRFNSIQISVGNGVDVISTGYIGDYYIENNCTITGWKLVANETGNLVIDVWRSNYSSFPPTNIQTIAGIEKPTLSGAIKNQDISLSSWSGSLSTDEWLRFNVDSASGIKQATLVLNTIV